MLEQILTISFFTAFFSAMVRMAVPLLYAGLGEVFAEKAGILKDRKSTRLNSSH